MARSAARLLWHMSCDPLGSLRHSGSPMDRFSPASQTIHANGIDHHVVTAGAADAPAILLIHGLGWDSTLWRPQIAWLAAAGWRVVASDLRGMGRTEKPDAPYSIDQYEDDMAALLETMGIDGAVVVGFSLGGTIAMALAARHPALVSALMVACGSAMSSREAEAGTEAMLERAATLGALRFAEEQAKAIFSPAWAAAHEQAVADFVVWRASMDQVGLRHAFRSSYGVDLRPELLAIEVPTRMLIAERDSFVSLETGREIAGCFGADLIVIEDAGHMASIEQPEAFDAALRAFLDRVEAETSTMAVRVEASL